MLDKLTSHPNMSLPLKHIKSDTTLTQQLLKLPLNNSPLYQLNKLSPCPHHHMFVMHSVRTNITDQLHKLHLPLNMMCGM